jgi:Spy/CpxP family protein refolding chaperone
MKTGWWILLLISLGLNLGLGLRLVRPGPPAAVPDDATALPTVWQGPRGSRPAPGDSTAWRKLMGRRLEHLTTRLELRPEQARIFQAAQATTERLRRQKRREVSAARARLRDLTTTAVIDRGAVRRAMAEMARREAEMDSLVAETLLDELEVLDPAQRARYLDFLPDGAGRHQGRGRRGHSGR